MAIPWYQLAVIWRAFIILRGSLCKEGLSHKEGFCHAKEGFCHAEGIFVRRDFVVQDLSGFIIQRGVLVRNEGFVMGGFVRADGFFIIQRDFVVRTVFCCLEGFCCAEGFFIVRSDFVVQRVILLCKEWFHRARRGFVVQRELRCLEGCHCLEGCCHLEGFHRAERFCHIMEGILAYILIPPSSVLHHKGIKKIIPLWLHFRRHPLL